MLSGKEHLQSCSPPPCSSFTIIFQHPWLPLPWVRTPEEDIPKVTIFVVVHFPLYIARILAFLILLLFLWSFTIPSNFSVFIEFAILKYFLALIMSNLKSYFVSCFNLSSQAPSQPHLPSHFIIFFYFLLTLSNLPHISGIEFILTECTFPGASYIIPKSGMWWFFVYSSNARGVCLFFFFFLVTVSMLTQSGFWTSPTDSWGNLSENWLSSIWLVSLRNVIWEKTWFCGLG